MTIVECMWKVSGRVQGVFFRKYTKLKADELGLSGWCRNTSDGLCVEGQVGGPEMAVRKMLHWIGHEGSPKSKPEHLEILSWSVTQLPLDHVPSFTILR